MQVEFSRGIFVRLFNCGKLGVQGAQWLFENGFSVLCEDGRVTDILKEEN